MAIDDPLYNRLMDEIRSLKAQLNTLQNRSVRAEIAGALSRITFAELPDPGKAGRLFYITDIEQGVVYYDTGAAWLPLAGSAMVFAIGDQGSFSNPGVTMTGITEVPTTDPGWAASSTVNMNPPNVYVKFYVNGSAYSVPGWST